MPRPAAYAATWPDGKAENIFTNVKDRSHDTMAELAVPAGGANGVILARRAADSAAGHST